MLLIFSVLSRSYLNLVLLYSPSSNSSKSEAFLLVVESTNSSFFFTIYKLDYICLEFFQSSKFLVAWREVQN